MAMMLSTRNRNRVTKFSVGIGGPNCACCDSYHNAKNKKKARRGVRRIEKQKLNREIREGGV